MVAFSKGCYVSEEREWGVVEMMDYFLEINEKNWYLNIFVGDLRAIAHTQHFKSSRYKIFLRESEKICWATKIYP